MSRPEWWLLERIRVLEEALRDALALIEHADTPNPHGPWCNGVHEAGGCEGAAKAGEMIDRICKVARGT